MNKSTLILFSGRKKSGKDTISQYIKQKLEKTHNVHILHFADSLKEICRDFFGIPSELLWGTDEQKNEKTTIQWYKLPHYNEICHQDGNHCGEFWNGIKWIKPLDYMTVREFLQQFGTNIMWAIFEDVFLYRLNRKIQDLKTSSWSGIPELFIVPDARFPNEMDYKFDSDKTVKVRLTRVITEDFHESETSLDNYKEFDIVVPNHNLSLSETFSFIDKNLVDLK